MVIDRTRRQRWSVRTSQLRLGHHEAAIANPSCSTSPLRRLKCYKNECMAKKSSKVEIDHRIDVIARMIVNAATTSQILRFCAVERGVKRRQAETYFARARETVRHDYSLKRAEFPRQSSWRPGRHHSEGNQVQSAIGCSGQRSLGGGINSVTPKVIRSSISRMLSPACR